MNVRRIALAAAIASGALALAACGSMMSDSSKPMMMANSMTIPMSAANEVPPNSSAGTGSAKVELEGMTLRWTISYSGLTGPVTAGHFHAPAMPGANAGVVVPFAGPLTSPISGTATLTQPQVDQLKSGMWYINLHTAANPGGEIRGQVK